MTAGTPSCCAARAVAATLAFLLGPPGPTAQSPPTLLRDVVSGSTGSSPVFLGGSGTFAVFRARDAARVEHVWWTDGTPAGTSRLGAARVQWATPVGTGLLLAAAGGVPGNHDLLHVAGDGVLRRVASVPAPVHWIDSELADVLLFASSDPGHGQEPWCTDGTPAGTRRIADLVPGAAGSDPRVFVRHGDSVVFLADDPGGPRLWRSDGGTPQPVSGVLPFRYADRAALAGDVLVLKTPSNRAQGWRQDLWAVDVITGAVAQLATTLNPPQVPTERLASFGDRVLFDWDDPVTGREPWISDGTQAGTRLLADLQPGAASSSPAIEDTGLANRTVFFATIGQSVHLVSTDGTTAGTASLGDLGAGRTWTSFSGGSFLRAGDDRVFALVLDIPTRTPVVLETDGTAAGTRIFAIGYLPHLLHDGRLYTHVDTATTGREPAVALAGPTAQRVGWGCGTPTRVPTLHGAAPRLGGPVRLRGDGAAPTAIAGILVAGPVAPSPAVLPNGCVVYVRGDGVALLTGFAPQSGSWRQSIPLPNSPVLQDVRVAVQAVLLGTGPAGTGFELSNGLLLQFSR